MDKAEIARRQLGAALDLFIRDLDPISVHCLACGGSEVAESLAKVANGAAFVEDILKSHPHMDKFQVHATRTQYWNAFKHAYTRAGKARDDTHLLTTFSEIENDTALFIGWFDFTSAGNPIPLEAQVFILWFFAMHKPEGAREFGVKAVDMFPDMALKDRRQQIAALRDAIRTAQEEWDLTDDLTMDHRPLTILADN